MRAGVRNRMTNYNPIVSYNELSGKRESYQMSKTEQDFVKKGYAAHTPIRGRPEAEIKIGGRGTDAPQIAKDLPHNHNRGKHFKNSKPLPDTLVTLKATNVREDTMNTKNLRRELAREGHLIVGGQYGHNLITNQPTGKGTFHVHADNKSELHKITNKIQQRGIQIDIANQYTPVWKN